ncbi:PadR family transcriptional regulator [alpha proteobacterium AAP38]|uniref:PadR family transcriptional regulator n=1 Tax=Niveispirillum sp. TaxID=1917217 RepID=UPI0006B922C2|nr:PadR family transcriptional regulator [alpha proteobacterium AAP38]
MIDVKTLCLGVLSRGDASGYEIRKEFEEGPLSHFSDAGFGSIYPALKRLLDEGQIVMLPHNGDGRPDKKLYRITPAGRHALYQALIKTPSADKLRSDLMFILSFGHLLPPRHLDRIIGDRISDYRQMIATLEVEGSTAHRTPGERFVEGMGLAIYRAVAGYLEEHRHELVAAALMESQVA